MKTELAMKLIADQMEWDDATATHEFTYLKLMVDYKYDHYQGFQPGSRFYLALIGWLSQFTSTADREVAYAFLKNNLIFFSQREMHHLVSLLMPIIDRTLRREVAVELGIPLFQTWLDDTAKMRVELRRIRTLFIALSDGARIDVFRRYNEGLVSNEQVLASSEISVDKWNDLLGNLTKAVQAKGLEQGEAYFERICLIDDFTGSGSSLIRFDEKTNEWKGKVQRFCKLYKTFLPFQCNGKWPVQIHHYLASTSACIKIEADLKEFAKAEPKFEFTTTYSYQLPQDIVVDDAAEASLVSLLRKCYDKNIEDDHTGSDIWFGYRQSGLPLILEHNTPNNSVAFLWAESGKREAMVTHSMKPLFVRRKRHSSHG